MQRGGKNKEAAEVERNRKQKVCRKFRGRSFIQGKPNTASPFSQFSLLSTFQRNIMEGSSDTQAFFDIDDIIFKSCMLLSPYHTALGDVAEHERQSVLQAMQAPSPTYKVARSWAASGASCGSVLEPAFQPGGGIYESPMTVNAGELILLDITAVIEATFQVLRMPYKKQNDKFKV